MFMHYVVGLEHRGLIFGMTTILKVVSKAPPIHVSVDRFSSNFTGLVSDRSRCACHGDSPLPKLHPNYLKKKKFVSLLAANF